MHFPGVRRQHLETRILLGGGHIGDLFEWICRDYTRLFAQDVLPNILPGPFV